MTEPWKVYQAPQAQTIGPWTAYQAANTAQAGQQAIAAAQRPDQLHPLAQDFPGRILHGMEAGIQGGAQLLPRAIAGVTSAFGTAPNKVSDYFQSEARRVDALNAGDEQNYQATRKYQAGGEPGFDWGAATGQVLSPTNAAMGTMMPAWAVTGSVPKLAATGAAMGGASAALTPVDMSKPGTDFAMEKAKQIGTGAAIGAVTNPIVSKTAQAFLPKAEPAPTRDQLARQAGQLYDQVRDAGVVVSPGSYQRFAASVSPQALREEGFSPKLQPKVQGVLDEIAGGVGQPQTLNDLEILRRIARGAAQSTDPSEARLGDLLIGKLDDYVQSLGARDLVGADPTRAVAESDAAVAALNKAREIWTRVKRSDVVELAIERARNAAGANFTQAGLETALRQQFRAIANSPSRFSQFAPDEQQAITSIVRGGPLQNSLRILGKLAPNNALALLSEIGAVVGGGIAGSPVAVGTAVGLGGAGMVARHAATQMSMNKVDALVDAIRRGGAAAGPVFNPAMRKLLAMTTQGAASAGAGSGSDAWRRALALAAIQPAAPQP